MLLETVRERLQLRDAKMVARYLKGGKLQSFDARFVYRTANLVMEQETCAWA